MPTVYIVVPCYNEEEVLPKTNGKLVEKLSQLINDGRADKKSRILYVDDGSADKTWELITGFHKEFDCVTGIKLAKNAGHQNALLAGLMKAREFSDCAVSLDADLQDDIEALDRFLERYSEGCEVVYGVRSKRDADTFFKRFTALCFYRLMRRLGVDIVHNHADYRLMGKNALNALSDFKESQSVLRGIVPLIGYKSGVVYYERKERAAGQTKYPLKKMLGFAIDGITSFSVRPLKIISNLGVIISVLSVFGLLYALISYFSGSAVPGWTAIVASIWLLGGIQLLCIGVVGEYIGKIYGEVKARPRYIIEKSLD